MKRKKERKISIFCAFKCLFLSFPFSGIVGSDVYVLLDKTTFLVSFSCFYLIFRDIYFPTTLFTTGSFKHSNLSFFICLFFRSALCIYVSIFSSFPFSSLRHFIRHLLHFFI